MSENDCKVGPKRSRLLSFEYTADQVSNFSHSNRPGDENKIRIDANFPIKRSRCQCLHCRQQLTVSRQPWGLIYKTNPDLLTRETILCQYTGFWLSECQVCWTQNSSSWLALAWPGQRESERLALAMTRPGLSCPQLTISLQTQTGYRNILHWDSGSGR